MEAHQTSNLGVLGSSPRQDVEKNFLGTQIDELSKKISDAFVNVQNQMLYF